jgi:DNA polymerase III subunit gamma/tau
LVKTLFGLDLKIGHDKRNTVKYVLIHPLLARKFLEKIVGNVKSKDKFVPDVILRSNNDIVKEFLKAYFEGDGYNNVSGASSIGCTSKSYVLMHQIQILLLKFGIVSSLKEKYTKKLSYSDKDYISWQLSIYSTNMEKFKNSIGFISDKKISEINKICCHRKVNPNKDVIPFVQDPLYNFRKSLPVKKNGHIVINNVHISAGPQWPPNCQSYTIKHKTHKCLTYNNLNDIIEYFNKFIRILQKNSYLIDNQYKLDLIKKIKSKIEYCRNIYNKNYFYSKVVSIKQNKSDVYDISKKGDDKSFVANGFINHNTTVARIVAAMENCKQGGKDPCGECSNCKDIFMGKSLEVIELDAGSRGKVDDIRELHKSLYQCPVECKTKYVIIDEAHSLTGSAAEASLKMIEEPPPFVRFILCTTEPDAFKPTIHSRCILWGFKKVLWPELFNHLKMVAGKEGLEYDEHALQIIAKYSKGSVRDSLQHLQKIINYVGKEKITTEATIEALGAINESLYFDLIDGVITNNMIKAFQTVNQLFIDGKEAKIVVDGLYEHLNNLLMVRTCGSEIDKFDFTQEEIKRYNHQNTITSGNVLLKMMNLVGHISFDVEYSLNPSHSFNKFVVESVQVVKSAQLANVKK